MTGAATRAGSKRAAMTWQRSDNLVPYQDAIVAMESRVEAIRSGEADELGWLLEHPPLYTAGTSAQPADLLVPDRFPVFRSGRGGQYTYHGPGQRVVYFMLDLKRRGPDLRRYIWQLEEGIIRTLSAFDIEGERREGRIGIWVVKPDGREAKIAAIGVRVRRWVTFHGIAVNLAPDLDHFSSIVPCGISGHGVTSIADLGRRATMAELDEVLMREFDDIFSPPPKGTTPSSRRSGRPM